MAVSDDNRYSAEDTRRAYTPTDPVGETGVAGAEGGEDPTAWRGTARPQRTAHQHPDGQSPLLAPEQEDARHVAASRPARPDEVPAAQQPARQEREAASAHLQHPPMEAAALTSA
jgi:hypothetical protein